MEMVGFLLPAKCRPMMTLDEKLVPVDPSRNESLNGQLLPARIFRLMSPIRHKTIKGSRVRTLMVGIYLRTCSLAFCFID